MRGSVPAAIGRVLHSVAHGERSGIVKAEFFAACPLLTASEQAFARTRMLPEEIAHRQVLTQWARRLAPDAAGLRTGFMAVMDRDTKASLAMTGDLRARLAWSLANIRWTEPMLLRLLAQLRPAIAALDRGLAADVAQVDGEEAGHVAFTSGILRRLEGEDPALLRHVRQVQTLTHRVYSILYFREAVIATRRLRAAGVGLGGRPEP